MSKDEDKLTLKEPKHENHVNVIESEAKQKREDMKRLDTDEDISEPKQDINGNECPSEDYDHNKDEWIVEEEWDNSCVKSEDDFRKESEQNLFNEERTKESDIDNDLADHGLTMDELRDEFMDELRDQFRDQNGSKDQLNDSLQPQLSDSEENGFSNELTDFDLTPNQMEDNEYQGLDGISCLFWEDWSFQKPWEGDCNVWEEDYWRPSCLPSTSTSEYIEWLEFDKPETEVLSWFDLEVEALMAEISNNKNLEIKQSVSGQVRGREEFDWHSKDRKSVLGFCLQTLSQNKDKLPDFDLLELLANFTAVESMTGTEKYFCENCTNNCASDGQKQFTNASKRALIACPPPVLTLHLKRFLADGNQRSVKLKKISTFVSFPLTFDLSPFVSKMYTYLYTTGDQHSKTPMTYSLYGVVEHSGTLWFGHYTAYVKLRPINCRQTKKFSFVDRFVSTTEVESVLKVIENNYFSHKSEFEDCPPQTIGHTSQANISDKWFHISDSSVTSSSVSEVLKSDAYLLFYERIA